MNAAFSTDPQDADLFDETCCPECDSTDVLLVDLGSEFEAPTYECDECRHCWGGTST